MASRKKQFGKTRSNTEKPACSIRIQSTAHVYLGDDAPVFSATKDGRVSFLPERVDDTIAALEAVLKFLKTWRRK